MKATTTYQRWLNRIKTLVSIGISDKLALSEHKRVRFINIIIYFNVIFLFAYLFVFLFSFKPILVLLCLIPLCLYGFIFYLNYRGYHTTAKVAIILSATLGLLATGLLIPETTELNVLFFFVIGYTWILFGLKDFKYILGSLGLMLVCYFYIELGTPPSFVMPYQVDISDDDVFVKISLVGVVFIFINILLYLLLLESEENITKLNQSLIASDQLFKEKEAIQKELALSLNELEQLALSSSQDLKMPLRGIVSFAQLLRKRYGNQLDKNGHEYIDYIEKEGKRQFRQIEGLLNYLKADHQTKIIQIVDTNTIVTQVIQSLKGVIAAQNVTLTMNMLPKVYCTNHDVEQIFQNLLSNAIKFSSSKPNPTIHIDANIKENMVEFMVKDNGIGFDMAYYDKIFGIFKTLSAEARQKGSGIGLSVCKKIVQSYGGKIWATSEKGEGATFYFSLPKGVEDIESVQPLSLTVHR